MSLAKYDPMAKDESPSISELSIREEARRALWEYTRQTYPTYQPTYTTTTNGAVYVTSGYYSTGGNSYGGM